MQQQFEHALRDRRQDEIVMTYFKLHNRIGWLNRISLRAQMEIWKNMIRLGNIRVSDIRQCSQYFMITLQLIDNSNQLDPIARDVFNYETRGFVYIFFTEAERDRVVDYIISGDEPYY
jgi:hypothetical protein